ncbi:VOC family protein [Arthrobacter sp. H14]|uniref:VOC family protein n=1 Tax=Arthrobacter sp. H14 TaxID=1312959 RepID=UPI00047D2D4B|nr:VOC family protein [Arthrobacter sp. H14]
MPQAPQLTLSAVVLGAPDAQELAGFYRRLLGWKEKYSEPGWVMLQAPDGGAGLSFQTESDYVRPVWPEAPGRQQMMMHLDIHVDDLDASGEHALAAGATLAEFQPQEGVRVYFDPAGHPFCLFLD